ncbi:MAG: MFS transporter [Atopobiaceae bacterium]
MNTPQKTTQADRAPKTARASEPVSWKLLVATLCAGWVVIWISRMIFMPIYPILSSFFGGVSHAQLGAISSFYFLGYVLMQIPSGILVDALGMRRVIVPGFIIFAAGEILIALSTTLPMMYAGSVIAGAGSGTFYGIAYTITNTYVPLDRKSVATALVNSGTALGSGIGLISAGTLVTAGVISWQALAATTALLALVMNAVFSKVLAPERLGTSNKASDSDKAQNAGGTHAAPDILRRMAKDVPTLFSRKKVAAYMLYFATLYAYYLLSAWLPSFLEAERGFSGSWAGSASSLVFFAGVPGALLMSRLADKNPQHRIAIMVALEVAATIFMLFIMVAASHVLIVLAIFLYGFFGKLTVEPLIISWLGDYAQRGSVTTMFGVFNFFGMCASVVAPLVTGALTDALHSSLFGCFVAAAVLLAGTGMFVVLSRDSVS